MNINKIKQGRKKLNLTQAELAPLLGVSLKTIKNYEQGLRKPSRAALMLLEMELKKSNRLNNNNNPSRLIKGGFLGEQ